jgi:hypothetical protein
MLVKDLIAELQKTNPDWEVDIFTTDYDGYIKFSVYNPNNTDEEVIVDLLKSDREKV